METLFTVAYPRMAESDARFIDEFRLRHDAARRDLVAAHFTLVFRVQDVEESEYTRHVKDVAASATPIEFTCRSATLGADAGDGTAHVFLVPDEGHSSIVRLHDRLYTGPLESFLRLDIPYIPHITIGSLPDRAQAKALCDELNARGLAIAGTLDALTVGALGDSGFIDRVSIALGSTAA